jgi:hypothetical protein
MIFRIVNWIMCALFVVAAVVQFNDPDPLLWVAIYGAAFLICLMVAVRGRISRALPAAVAIVAVAWSVATIAGGPAAAQYTHMFDAWEMQSLPVEEAREAAGLLIVAAWMAAVTARRRHGRTR